MDSETGMVNLPYLEFYPYIINKIQFIYFFFDIFLLQNMDKSQRSKTVTIFWTSLFLKFILKELRKNFDIDDMTLKIPTKIISVSFSKLLKRLYDDVLF